MLKKTIHHNITHEWFKLFHKTDKFIYTKSGVNELEKINNEIKTITDSLLIEIRQIYNEHFNINEDYRYYKIILGRWLYHFINNVYLINLLIKNNQIRIHSKKNKITYVLCRNSEGYYQNSYLSNTFYNNLLYSIINPNNDNYKFLLNNNNDSKRIYLRKLKSNIKKFHDKFLLKTNKILSKDLILVVDPYYTKRYFYNSFWFFLKSKGKIIHQEFHQEESIKEINFSLRYKFDSIIYRSGNQLLNYSSNLVFKFMPICYLEEFLRLRAKAKKWHNNNTNCKSFFTANSIHSNDFFKYLVAHDNRIPISIIQHGNGYGSFKFLSAEVYEKSIAKKYYTWGWGDLKLPHPKLNSSRTVSYNSKSRIIFTFPSITFSPGLLETTHLYYIQMNEIKEDSNIFIENISPRLKEVLVKRELKQNNLLEMELEYPLKKDCFKNFNSSLLNSKIHLTNHFGTPFLESIAMNIPTVLFLSNYKDYLKEDVIEIFEELENVKIIFDNPKTASEHINFYYNKIDAWWLKDSTQKALSKFKLKFCVHNLNWKNIWVKELLKSD